MFSHVGAYVQCVERGSSTSDVAQCAWNIDAEDARECVEGDCGREIGVINPWLVEGGHDGMLGWGGAATPLCDDGISRQSLVMYGRVVILWW